MSEGKRKALDPAALVKPLPGDPMTVKKPRTKEKEKMIKHYVYPCMKDGEKNGVYYWNVKCEPFLPHSITGDRLAKDVSAKMQICRAVWRGEHEASGRYGKFTQEAELKVMFKTMLGYKHAQSLVKAALRPDQVWEESSRGEDEIEQPVVEVKTRGLAMLEITGRLYDIDDWFMKTVGAVQDGDVPTCEMLVVRVNGDEDRQQAVDNITVVCNHLGYAVNYTNEINWSRSARASPCVSALADHAPVTPAPQIRSTYFAVQVTDESLPDLQPEIPDPESPIIRMGMAAGPTRLRAGDLGGGWVCDTDVRSKRRARTRARRKRFFALATPVLLVPGTHVKHGYTAISRVRGVSNHLPTP